MNTQGNQEGTIGNHFMYPNMMQQGTQYMYPNMMMQQPNMMMPQPQPNMVMQMMQQPNMMMQPQPNMVMQMMPQPNMMMQQPNMVMPMFQQQQPNMMMPMFQQQQPNMMMPMFQQQQPNMMQPIINKQQIIQNPIEVIDKQSKIKKTTSKKNLRSVVNDIINQDEQDDQVDMEIEYMQANINEGTRVLTHNTEPEQLLINQFNNVNLITKNKPKKKSHSDINFKQWDDGRNIITNLKPLNNEDAHFNNDTHPNEIYIVEFKTGAIENIKAIDINDSTLVAYNIIYKHNTNLTQNNIQITGSSMIYVRCSSENDISIETQIQGCVDYAKLHGFMLTGVYIDNGMSGRKGNNLKNGELGYWTQYFQNGTHLLIYSIDRLTRHLLSGITYIDSLLQRQIATHFVSNKIIYNSMISSMHKSMFQQELQTAEKYSNDTSEKIKGTLKRLKDQGSIIGGRIPYGKKRIVIDGIRKQIPNTTEIENIKTIKQKFYELWKHYDKYSHLIKNKTNFQIIKYLTTWCNENHIKYRNNIPFTHSQIQTIILKNKSKL